MPRYQLCLKKNLVREHKLFIKCSRFQWMEEKIYGENHLSLLKGKIVLTMKTHTVQCSAEKENKHEKLEVGLFCIDWIMMKV